MKISYSTEVLSDFLRQYVHGESCCKARLCYPLASYQDCCWQLEGQLVMSPC